MCHIAKYLFTQGVIVSLSYLVIQLYISFVRKKTNSGNSGGVFFVRNMTVF